MERPYPTSGAPVDSHAYSDLGALSVKAPDNDDSQGARAASAAIGIVLEPSQPGIISVRPFINYSYLWWITGAFLSAHSEGHITVTTVTEADGNVLDHRDLMLWSQTTKSDGYGDSADGIAWPPNVEVKFVADPGTRYVAFIGAAVSGDQSGVRGVLVFPSWSKFSANVDLTIPWIVADLKD